MVSQQAIPGNTAAAGSHCQKCLSSSPKFNKSLQGGPRCRSRQCRKGMNNYLCFKWPHRPNKSQSPPRRHQSHGFTVFTPLKVPFFQSITSPIPFPQGDKCCLPIPWSPTWYIHLSTPGSTTMHTSYSDSNQCHAGQSGGCPLFPFPVSSSIFITICHLPL